MSEWTQILRGFMQILKISAVYFMWNLKICQDAPNQGQDYLVLLMIEIFRIFMVEKFSCLSLVEPKNLPGCPKPRARWAGPLLKTQCEGLVIRSVFKYLVIHIHGNHVDVCTLFHFWSTLHAETDMADPFHRVCFPELFLHHLADFQITFKIFLNLLSLFKIN